jgi:hypothetical protein
MRHVIYCEFVANGANQLICPVCLKYTDIVDDKALIWLHRNGGDGTCFECSGIEAELIPHQLIADDEDFTIRVNRATRYSKLIKPSWTPAGRAAIAANKHLVNILTRLAHVGVGAHPACQYVHISTDLGEEMGNEE